MSDNIIWHSFVYFCVIFCLLRSEFNPKCIVSRSSTIKYTVGAILSLKHAICDISFHFDVNMCKIYSSSFQENMLSLASSDEMVDNIASAAESAPWGDI